ncbi:MAG: hypothetical protein Q8O42_15070 [Acidobacteriota bacterium]|nr:hypothetical protein [Acidobacteriota bacterium]MDP2320648.1 hypothetical protein [Acidobacteriota bacterium]
MTPTDPARIAIHNESNRTVSVAEMRAYLDAPVSDFEREQILELARWFRLRYPTGAQRLSYVRRAYARWAGR